MSIVLDHFQMWTQMVVTLATSSCMKRNDAYIITPHIATSGSSCNGVTTTSAGNGETIPSTHLSTPSHVWRDREHTHNQVCVATPDIPVKTNRTTNPNHLYDPVEEGHGIRGSLDVDEQGYTIPSWGQVHKWCCSNNEHSIVCTCVAVYAIKVQGN